MPGDVEERLAAVEAENVALKGGLKELGEVVVSLIARGDPSEVRSWLLVDDAEVAGFMLADLGSWVDQVWFRYRDAQKLQPCWLYHPEIVEELWVLMNVHRACFRKGGSWSMFADWHARLRPSAVERIKKYATSCAPGQHQAGKDFDPAVRPVVPGLADAPAVADHWATHGTCPYPTSAPI